MIFLAFFGVACDAKFSRPHHLALIRVGRWLPESAEHENRFELSSSNSYLVSGQNTRLPWRGSPLVLGNKLSCVLERFNDSFTFRRFLDLVALGESWRVFWLEACCLVNRCSLALDNGTVTLQEKHQFLYFESNDEELNILIFDKEVPFLVCWFATTRRTLLVPCFAVVSSNVLPLAWVRQDGVCLKGGLWRVAWNDVGKSLACDSLWFVNSWNTAANLCFLYNFWEKELGVAGVPMSLFSFEASLRVESFSSAMLVRQSFHIVWVFLHFGSMKMCVPAMELFHGHRYPCCEVGDLCKQ